MNSPILPEFELVPNFQGHTRQGNVREFFSSIFQGQGIVRNFMICQGKMKFCQNIREFYISVM